MSVKGEKEIECEKVYTSEEISKLGFVYVSDFGENLQIFGTGNKRCVLEPFGDGMFKAITDIYTV